MLNMYVFHIQLMLVGDNTAVEISSLCIQTLDFQSIYLCVNHLPWCSAWDRFSGCFKSDECSDDGKYTPHINKTMPPKLETEANRNQPHPQQCSSLVRFEVSLLPLDQDNLCHHQGGYQDQHHLHVHRLMTPVFLMEPLMLNPPSFFFW